MTSLALQLPPDFPESGFYRKYDHNPQGFPGNGIFYVRGQPAFNKKHGPIVLYHPLARNAPVFVGLGHYALDYKPLAEFLEPGDVDGKKIPRYQRITDWEEELKWRTEFIHMYGPNRF